VHFEPDRPAAANELRLPEFCTRASSLYMPLAWAAGDDGLLLTICRPGSATFKRRGCLWATWGIDIHQQARTHMADDEDVPIIMKQTDGRTEGFAGQSTNAA
jgi:hypothetical protein